MSLLKRAVYGGLVAPFFLVVCGCTAPAPSSCLSRGVQIVPTATRQSDPDLFIPPGPPNGGDEVDGCPPSTPIEIATEPPLTQFRATEVVNLSLDRVNQDVIATAVGDDMLAVAWVSDGAVYVGLSRGGNHFQVRRVDWGQQASLTFSRVNRLHLAYEQDGRIFYRAADQGVHPADVSPIFVEHGRGPQVVVDELNWAHVLYEQDGSIFKAKHLSNDSWLRQFVAYGTDLAVVPFYNEKELILWGIPTGTYWFGILLAARHNGQLRVFRYLSWFNVWEQVATFAIPAGEEMSGRAGLDFQAVSQEEAWVYVAWVTKRPFLGEVGPVYGQPVFRASNPLFPEQIANPGHIYQGLNGVVWHSADTPFDAGIWQTVDVVDSTGPIVVQAWGLVETAVETQMSLQIGVDATGGQNPNGANVVWSEAVAATTFTPLQVSVMAQGSQATVFLRGTHPTAEVAATAVWDFVTIQNGNGLNLDFEGPFAGETGLVVPEGWTAWYEDGGHHSPNGRDVDAVYVAWSDNGGTDWSPPEMVVANRHLTGGYTGAIRPDVTPVISMATDPPSVTLFYIYEAGDPAPRSTFLRFGRPYLAQCTLGTAVCTDSPGIPLLPRHVVRPSYRLLVASDPFNPNRALLAWDSLQTDITNKDVHLTYVVVR